MQCFSLLENQAVIAVIQKLMIKVISNISFIELNSLSCSIAVVRN